MMPENYKRAFLVDMGIMIGSIALLSGLLFWLSSNVDDLAGKIALDEATIQKRAGTVDKLADLKAAVPVAQKYQANMDMLLPTKDHLIDFSRWLDTLSRGHSLSLNFAFQPNQIDATDVAPGSIGFSLDVNGGLADLRAFLDDLEIHGSRFLVRINTFDINSTGGSNYHATLNGQVFYR